MPGLKRINQVAQQRQQDLTATTTYFVMDPDCREIHGIELTDEMRENGIRLTASEAMSLVASGAVTTSKEQATAAHEASKARAEAKAQAAEQAAVDAAAREDEILKTAVANTAGTENAVQAPEAQQSPSEPVAPEPAAPEPAPAAAEDHPQTWAEGQQSH